MQSFGNCFTALMSIKEEKSFSLKKKREFEKGLINVAFFNSNDEMIVKKINLDEGKSLPSRHVELHISKSN